jgi:phage shock protein A
MGILGRINSLIKSNLNELLSKAEDPTKQYEQAVLDMEDSLQQAKKQVIQAIADEKRLVMEADRKREEVLRWDGRAQAAVRAGDDALAKEALQQKLRSEDEERQLRKTAAEQRGLADELKASLVQLDAKLKDARLKKDSVLARYKAVVGTKKNRAGSLYDSTAFDSFDRQARSIDDLDARLEAMSELSDEPAKAALEDKFKELDKGSGVDDELAALKAKLSKK